MTYKMCWLTNGSELVNSAFLTDRELKDQQQAAEIDTGGNFWWIESKDEPDLPRSQFFSHIPRKNDPRLE